MHGTTLLFFLLVSVFCADYVLAKHAHPARPRAAERHFHKRNARSFDNPLIAKRQVRAEDIRAGKKKRDCPVPLVSGVCNCPSGTFCNNDCVDTTSDQANCGACDFDCATYYATGSDCIDSTCSCPVPESRCNGGCANFLTDPNNCGACGLHCDLIVAPGAVCAGGACQCPAPQTQCPGQCADLMSDDANCGTCGNACADDATCQGWACTCDDPSLGNCGGSCVDFNTDANNCGDCGFICSGGSICVDGGCEPA